MKKKEAKRLIEGFKKLTCGDEVRLAQQQLLSIQESCIFISKTLLGGDLPAWVQMKLTQAEQDLGDIKNYLESLKL